MRRCLLVLFVLLALPCSATAAPVLVLGADGHAHERDDRFLPAAAATPAPIGLALHATAASRARRHASPLTVRSVLSRLRRDRSITPAHYRRTLGAFDAALRTERHLRGTRRAELAAVTVNVHAIAAAGELTASRLAALTATLNANRRWWRSNAAPLPDARIEFAGSQLVWEYYPGQGLELQVLGTFGRANAMYTAGPAHYPAMRRLLAQMIPLASRRGGGSTWEYYFAFGGGQPPWTSAMAQATGLEALSRAYLATHDAYYLHVAASALRIFRRAPPVGVAVPTPRGIRFVQYSFAASLSILNAFLQTLIGLDDYANVSGNRVARALFARGNAEAIAEVPAFNTGAWSLYQPGLRGHAQLPPAGHRLSAPAVQADGGAGLLQDRPRVRRRPQDAPVADRSDDRGQPAPAVRASV